MGILGIVALAGAFGLSMGLYLIASQTSYKKTAVLCLVAAVSFFGLAILGDLRMAKMERELNAYRAARTEQAVSQSSSDVAIARDSVSVSSNTGKITSSFLGIGSVLDAWAGVVEGSGFGNDPGFPIAKIDTEYGDHLYAILAPQDISDGNIVELVGVYRGKDHIATVARRRIGWDKPSP